MIGLADRLVNLVVNFNHVQKRPDFNHEFSGNYNKVFSYKIGTPILVVQKCIGSKLHVGVV